MLGEQGCMASRAGSFLQLSCVCGGGAAGGATVRTHVSSEGPEARPGVLRDSGQSCCCSDLQPSLDAGSVCRMDFDLHCLPPLSSPGSQEGQQPHLMRKKPETPRGQPFTPGHCGLQPPLGQSPTLFWGHGAPG